MKININKKYQKPPMRNSGFNWSENIEDTIVVQKDTILYHVSVWEELKGFYPTITCFSTEKPVMEAIDSYVYIAIPKTDITGETIQHSPNEIRIDLEKTQNNIEIFYAGTIKSTGIKKVDNYGLYQGELIRFNFIKQFKKIEEQLNKRFKKEFYNNVKHYQKIIEA